MEHLLWHRIRWSQACGTHIQFFLHPRTFNLTSSGKSLTTTLVGVCRLYTIVPTIQSPLPYHSCSSQNFFCKMKVDLSWERSGIYNLGIRCILTNFSYGIVSPLFLALLWTACMFSGRKGTSSRANNSILRVLWTVLWKRCLLSHWNRETTEEYLDFRWPLLGKTNITSGN